MKTPAAGAFKTSCGDFSNSKEENVPLILWRGWRLPGTELAALSLSESSGALPTLKSSLIANKVHEHVNANALHVLRSHNIYVLRRRMLKNLHCFV